jgi:plasmid stabilization system protein ParE
MARQIVWSANAQAERLAILKYWSDRNGFTRYSEKLDGMLRTALRVIATNPRLGRPTNDPEVRVKIIGDHMLFYSYTATEVHVLSVWHQKRDPKERPY